MEHFPFRTRESGSGSGPDRARSRAVEPSTTSVATALEYVKGQRIWLKSHPHYDEAWLRDVIAQDPSLLGLGTVRVRQVEKGQAGGGRVDLLLENARRPKRYVVEIMLGRMDESHIVRCIEYWDLEQNRSPRLDHCAVLVAEDLTARFQNVLRLIHRVIPIIVLEVSAIEVAGKLVLHFTRVFDEPRALTEAVEVFGRDFWEARGCKASLQIMDQCLEILRELDPRLDAIYRRQHVSVGRDQHANNLVTFRPMKHFLRVDVKTANLRAFRACYQEDELHVLDIDYRWRSLRLLLVETELHQHRDLLRRVFHSALQEAAAGNANGRQMKLWTDAEGRLAE